MVELDSDTPRLAQFDQYIRTVKDKSILRKTVIAADKIRSHVILEQGAPEELLAKAEQMLVQLGLEASSSEEFKTPKDVIFHSGRWNDVFYRRHVKPKEQV